MQPSVQNIAAWQVGPKEVPLKIGPEHSPATPARDEVVIRTKCVAINPIDWKLQRFAFMPLEYPTILGRDVVGDFVLVGENVSNVKVGDRVIGHCLGSAYEGNRYGAFQRFATCPSRVVAKIPDFINFANAAVLPLALSTASSALLDGLRLALSGFEPKQREEYVLVWGASSSVGCVAIQLARASGYHVVTTASAKNHELAKELGATAVFDHKNDEIFQGITNALRGRRLAGAFDCIGENATAHVCGKILETQGGGQIVSVLPPPEDLPSNVTASMVRGNAPGLADPSLAQDVWKSFVPEALAQGVLRPKSEPLVVSSGLEKIQSALDLASEGVSARKVVVEIA